MKSNVKEYREALDELDRIFFLVLERYKTNYPLQAAYPTEENKTLYNESKNHLDNTYSDLFILDNKVDSSISQLNKTIEQKDSTISSLRSRFKTDKSKFDNISQTDLAALPLKKEILEFRFQSNIQLGYYIVGIIAILILIWLGMKPPIPVAIPVIGPLIKKKELVSLQTAKIATGATAILAAFIANYYIK